MNDLEHRIMGNISIAKSFKGILRISPIIDGKEIDEFLVTPYYKNFNGAFKDSVVESESKLIKLNFADGSYNETGKPLSGDLKRYSNEDVFYNAKLPVTDSVGNYMNINMGCDGTVFGSKTNSIYNNNFESNSFPVLEANALTIGLEKIKPDKNPRGLDIPHKQIAHGGKLNILDGPAGEAKIVTENRISQSDLSETEVNTYSSFKTKEHKNYRTIITNGTNPVKEYDGIVHIQEWNEKDKKDSSIINSTVKIRNLQDIVKERLEKYLQNSVVEMPTGSVIWQYVNLSKWYGVNDNGNDDLSTSSSGEKKTIYAGARPKMVDTGVNAKSDNKYPFFSSRVQGACKEVNRLLDSNSNRYTNDDGSTNIIDVKEIIPVYKRDYVLCDGTVYYVPTTLNGDNSNGGLELNDTAAYKRFKDLFSTIGYYYTEQKNLKNHYSYRKMEDGSGRYEFWKITEEDHPSGMQTDGIFLIDKVENNLDVLFGRDYCQLICFYYLYNAILNKVFLDDTTDTLFDRDKAEEWLKNKKFDKADLFASPLPENSNEKQLYYIQTVCNPKSTPKSFKINLGTEVNSFKSVITLSSGGTRCEVWQLPEVQLILDLFDCLYGSGKLSYKYDSQPGEIKTTPRLLGGVAITAKLKKYCTYYFQVPNFNIFKDGKYKMGCFMGSTATATFRNTDKFDQTYSNCYFTANELPHRHNLFIGWNHYGQKNPACEQVPPKLASIYKSSERCSAYGIFKTTGNTPAVGCTETLNNYVVQFDRNVKLNTDWATDYSDLDTNLNEDCLYYCKRMNYKYETTEETEEGEEKTVTHYAIFEPLRGITSNQVEETYKDSEKLNLAYSANLLANSAEFFAPESINMLPLIKL